MKVQSTALSLCLVLAAGIAAYGAGRLQADSTPTRKTSQETSEQRVAASQDRYVGVYITSVTRQIRMSDLAKAYPAQQAGLVDKGRLAADAIVGWYDKGNSYHEQKMQNALKRDMGGIRILPEMLRGEALRGAEASQPK